MFTTNLYVLSEHKVSTRAKMLWFAARSTLIFYCIVDRLSIVALELANQKSRTVVPLDQMAKNRKVLRNLATKALYSCVVENNSAFWQVIT